jgi:tetratricopeptide (TPR) repeat protein
MLSPSEISEELGHGMDILETSLQDIPERQRSIRAIFDYTWANLNRKEREHLRKLSVFRGGCSIRAAREIMGASLPALRSLVDKSLLQATVRDRYDIHELLRQFAAEKLADDPDDKTKIYDAHSAYYLRAVAQREDALFSRRFVETMAEIDAVLDNVRAAWRWAVEKRHVELLEQAIKCLFYYHRWHKNVQFLIKDAQVVVDQFIDSKVPQERFVMAWALLYKGWDLSNREDKALVESGLTILREPALDHLDTRAAMAFGLSRLGHIESLSDTDRSRVLMVESLAIYESIGDRHGVAGVLLLLSIIAGNNADFGEQERLARSSHAIREELGNPLELSESLRLVAFALIMQGRIEEGLEIGRNLEAIAHSMGEDYAPAVLGNLPAIYRQAGLFEEAYRRFGEVAAANENIGDPTMVLSSSLWQAWVGLHLGHYRQFLSVASDQRDVYSSRYYLGHLELGRAVSLLGLDKPEDAIEESRKAVESFRLGGLLPRLSQSLATLALVLRALGDVDSARERLSEALLLAIQMQSPPVLCYSLSTAALLLADEGAEERAVAVYALATQNLIVTNSRWFYDVAGKVIEAIDNALPPAEAEAARAKGAKMDLWTTANDLLLEFRVTPYAD